MSVLTSRREFIKQASAVAIVSNLPLALFSQTYKSRDKIWACLIHLSFNMWEGYISPHRPFRGFRPDLELSESLWHDSLLKMASNGINMIVIDLGDAVRYRSHPEIAVNKAWTPHRLKKELKFIRHLGIEPIPKLNFSAAHDTWLKKYSRMVSTKKYYAVCKDLIDETIDIFDTPRFFHLGFDEETAEAQAHYNYVVVRRNNDWWTDFYYLIDVVQKKGVRPWIWSDYLLRDSEVFFKKMPKSVVQSNWFYGRKFVTTNANVKAYVDLENHGYDQIPTSSNYLNDVNTINTVKFCTENISDTKLYGFLQTYWKPTIQEYRGNIMNAIELSGKAKEWFLKNI